MFACAVLAIASIGGLVWSWNRTIERDAYSESSILDTDTSRARLNGVVSSSLSPDPKSLSAIKLIDINNASIAELDLLPGIGPALGAQIIADREANGRFDTIDDLQRVSGIGPKKVEKIRALVVLGDLATD